MSVGFYRAADTDLSPGLSALGQAATQECPDLTCNFVGNLERRQMAGLRDGRHPGGRNFLGPAPAQAAIRLKLPRRLPGLGCYSRSRVHRTHPNRAGHMQHNENQFSNCQLLGPTNAMTRPNNGETRARALLALGPGRSTERR